MKYTLWYIIYLANLVSLYGAVSRNDPVMSIISLVILAGLPLAVPRRSE